VKRKILTISLSLLLAVLAGITSYRAFKWRIISWWIGLPASEYSVTLERDVSMTGADGTVLSADVYRPAADARFPVVLIRTPYGKRNRDQMYHLIGGVFASHGFGCVVQDVRGRYGSGGSFHPFFNEDTDGADAVEWTAGLDWSSGAVGMFGMSYFGATQWLASPRAGPALRAIVPAVTSQSTYRLWAERGVFRLNLTFLWHYMHELRERREYDAIEWERGLESLPVIEADDRTYHDNWKYDEWLEHPLPDSYWRGISVDHLVPEMSAPALLVAGWYDPFVEVMLDDFRRMRASGRGDARQSHIIIGPWVHGMKSKFEAMDYGKISRFEGAMAHILRWYGCWLRGDENGVRNEDPVRYFVMGGNLWRTAKEWPPQGVKPERFYLHSSGTLDRNRPGREKPDTYVYDPADPVPSMGGEAIYDNLNPGPADQRKIEARKDVLVYTSAPFSRDTEISGPVTLVLYASSSAPDTDFIARLTQVYPDGRSLCLTTGIVRARFRGSLKKPSFLEKGKVYRFDIRVGDTSVLVKKGHRIRLHVTSSDFPRFNRNLNTREEPAAGSIIKKAEQEIYHDRTYQSCLVLPVMRRKGD